MIPGESTDNTVKTKGIHMTNNDKIGVVMPPMRLHGRKQLFTNETEVTDGNVCDILNSVLPDFSVIRHEIQYLDRYNRGIQPVLDRIKKVNAEICNKVVVNRANQIVTFKTSEFVGEPIQYVSRGTKETTPSKIEILNSMLISEGKRAKDIELAYKMFVCGVGYRLVMSEKMKVYNDGDIFDEAPFEIYIPDSQTTFVVKVNDVTKRVLMGVTYVYLDDSMTNVQYTVYTDNETYYIEGTEYSADKIVGKQIHKFGMIPLIEYPCNTIRTGSFESVIPLLDARNLLMSNRMDGIEQFIQAIMVFQGVDISREQLLELRDLGAIKIPPDTNGQSSRVYYLNEQLDQSQTQTLVDDIDQTILEIVGMPSQGNANTSDSSNNGAVIMKNGWWNAEARAKETSGLWEKSEIEFLKVILKICRDANILDGLAVSDVEVKFHRENYEDLLVKTQSFSTLRNSGCAPLQSFKLAKLGTDYESESIQFEKYQNMIRQQELDDMAVQLRDRMSEPVDDSESV